MLKTNLDQLRALASSQEGFFTTNDAEAAGFTRDLLIYHAKCGHWIKIDRGIFRFPGYAETQTAEFIRWTLWAVGYRRGRLVAVSHESALSFYGLAERAPEVVHLSVPAVGFRKEKAGVRVHPGVIGTEDCVAMGSFRVTTPARTLADMKPDLMLSRRWVDTVRLAEQKRLVDESSARNFLMEIPGYACVMAQADKETAMTNHPCTVSVKAASPALAQFPFAGVAAHRPIRRSGMWGSRSAFTLVELLVVIAIIGILAAMLMPTLAKSMTLARQTQCMNNMKQCAQIFTLYANDYNDWIPPSFDVANSRRWQWMLMELGYAPEGRIWHTPDITICPSQQGVTGSPGNCGYVMNNHWSNNPLPQRFMNLRELKRKPVIMLIDSRNILQCEQSRTFCFQDRLSRHMNGYNTLFTDGHIKWYPDGGDPDITDAVWAP